MFAETLEFAYDHLEIADPVAQFGGRGQLHSSPAQILDQATVGVGGIQATAGQKNDQENQKSQANEEFYSNRPMRKHRDLLVATVTVRRPPGTGSCFGPLRPPYRKHVKAEKCACPLSTGKSISVV